MRALEERLNLAKTVLQLLNIQPLCRTKLENKTVKKTGTHASFTCIFKFLIKKGYVQKSSKLFRAEYVITEKGIKFLEAI